MVGSLEELELNENCRIRDNDNSDRRISYIAIYITATARYHSDILNLKPLDNISLDVASTIAPPLAVTLEPYRETPVLFIAPTEARTSMLENTTAYIS